MLQEAFHRAFTPATAIMGRLKYAQKFILIGLVLLAPLAFVGYSYLQQQGTQTAFSAKERVGVAYIQPLNALLGTLVQARDAAVKGTAVDKSAVANAVVRHQVVVVCGETGSGKTTQLPKICLEIGRGAEGIIGEI